MSRLGPYERVVVRRVRDDHESVGGFEGLLHLGVRYLPPAQGLNKEENPGMTKSW